VSTVAHAVLTWFLEDTSPLYMATTNSAITPTTIKIMYINSIIILLNVIIVIIYPIPNIIYHSNVSLWAIIIYMLLTIALLNEII
jgi:hypothetical protein